MAVTDHPLVGLGYTHPSLPHAFIRLEDSAAGADTGSSAIVAEEVPVAMVYNGRPHVVVMATPSHLEDLAVGFSLTEGIVRDVADIQRVEVVRASHGIELQIEIGADAAALVERRVRGLVSRTGCGLCGVEAIGDAIRVPAEVGHALAVSPAALWRANAELSLEQTLNIETNTVHAAGWATPDGAMRVVREDVGRHNALDKVLGALAQSGTPARSGFLVVTSRASYEMVQKAAVCGVELLAAISRPTGLAIRFAESAGLTLVGLLRGRSANVYCGVERLTSS